MTELKQQTLDLIRELTEEKRVAHKFPTWPTMLQLRQRLGEGVKQALRELVKEGTIAYHLNVNGIPMFEITNPQQQEQ